MKPQNSNIFKMGARTPQQRGLDFEVETERLFRRLGYLHVRQDVRLVDPHGNASQIDVVAGLFRPTYVECKNYSTRPVPLSDVAKFASVLELNGIPASRGIFITNSTYVPRARMIGIRTVDGKQLVQWHRMARAKRLRGWMGVIGLLGLVWITQAHP